MEGASQSSRAGHIKKPAMSGFFNVVCCRADLDLFRFDKRAGSLFGRWHSQRPAAESAMQGVNQSFR